jgi:3-phenylpropionate/cinnamic acid dioxygenase small subunit
MTDLQATPAGLAGVDLTTRATISDFLFMEARLLDEHDYDGWLELWHNAGVYLVPANGDNIDPDRQVSIIYDNRRRLSRRVEQLQTGYRYAQLPQSRTQHFITNIEVAEGDDGRFSVRCAYMIMEARFGNVRNWAGRALFELVPDASGELRILGKTVIFIDNDLPVNTMAFLP